MRQLPLAGLRMSPALHAADPAALLRRSQTEIGAAGELQGRSSALTALGGEMQSGVWVSPAGAAFLTTADEQARRVDVAAGLLEQLGAALGVLAGRLAAAQQAAIVAVDHGRRLDAQIEDFNHSVAQQHALLPQDPDSLLAAGPQAAELSVRSAVAAGELAAAEADARRAWAQAEIDFDVVGYATPGKRAQMSAGSWDPEASVFLAAAARATSCGPMDELALPTNGRLTGPDGRTYDLVVQTTRGSDGRLLVSTQEQPRESKGWTRLAVRLGTTEYGRKASGWDKVAVTFGGAAGAAYPEGGTFAPALLGRLHVMPDGGAYLPDEPIADEPSIKEAPAAPARTGSDDRYWGPPRVGLAAGRKSSTPDGIGLVDGAIAGFLLAGRLDDGRAAGYRIVFEESATGERRARMQLYRVVASPNQPPTTESAGGYVDKSGHLAGAPVTGEAPDRLPMITPAHH